MAGLSSCTNCNVAHAHAHRAGDSKGVGLPSGLASLEHETHESDAIGAFGTRSLSASEWGEILWPASYQLTNAMLNGVPNAVDSTDTTSTNPGSWSNGMASDTTFEYLYDRPKACLYRGSRY
jgi:hypothetical protein